MSKYLLVFTALFCGLMMAACQPAEPEGKLPVATPESAETPVDEVAGSGGGVSIHGAGAGGIAPVTGTENLQGSGGGGGGVGQAAKDAAKDAAGSMGSGSLDQSGEGE